jgi:DeoR family transcriptional regulator of aga operon
VKVIVIIVVNFFRKRDSEGPRKLGRVKGGSTYVAVKTQDRANQILHLLLQQGSSCVEDLAELVSSSAASVRRDLIKLEERGLVTRAHGSVELAGKRTFEPFKFDAAFPLREERFADEKRRIALAAAEMVTEGDTIALSPGTTTTQLARSLRHREGIHIVTSAVNIGMELSSQPNAKVTLTGGSIRWPGSFSMVGATAFHSIQKLHFDKVFMGACGIHPEHGLTVIESDEALILGEMVKRGRQVIAVADASKLGMISGNNVCATSQIHTIITDDSISPELVEVFRRQQVRVVIV